MTYAIYIEPINEIWEVDYYTYNHPIEFRFVVRDRAIIEVFAIKLGEI